MGLAGMRDGRLSGRDVNGGGSVRLGRRVLLGLVRGHWDAGGTERDGSTA